MVWGVVVRCNVLFGSEKPHENSTNKLRFVTKDYFRLLCNRKWIIEPVYNLFKLKRCRPYVYPYMEL